MSPYNKTYRGFHRNEFKRKRKLKFLRVSIILIFDILFSILLAIRSIARKTIFKVLPMIATVLYHIFFKTVLLNFYRLILQLNRRYKTTFPQERNPLFFLLSNRYVSHTVIVLIILTTTLHNLQIKNLRAEEFGKTALFGKLSQAETSLENFTEETITPDITAPPLEPDPSQNSPYVSQKIQLTDEVEETPVLSQGGSAILKPNLTETIDTPKPRDSTIVYPVELNDTIFDIAERFNISVNTILWANKLTSRSIIRPGDELRILQSTGVEHAVKSGETVGSIAAKYNVPQEDILEVNKISMIDTIKIGMLLIIPDGRPLYTPPPPKAIARPQETVFEPDLSDSGASDLFWPTNCRRITQYFKGWRHTGIDIACGMGVNVYAAADGIVERAGGGWNGGYGNMIIMRHNDGTKTLYGHLQAGGILVSPGEYIKKGRVIGLMGSSGRSTGPHVHFEIIINGTRVNPFNRL